jgi:hypothetical protein
VEMETQYPPPETWISFTRWVAVSMLMWDVQMWGEFRLLTSKRRTLLSYNITDKYFPLGAIFKMRFVVGEDLRFFGSPGYSKFQLRNHSLQRYSLKRFLICWRGLWKLWV